MTQDSAFHHTYILHVWRSLSTQATDTTIFSSQVIHALWTLSEHTYNCKACLHLVLWCSDNSVLGILAWDFWAVHYWEIKVNQSAAYWPHRKLPVSGSFSAFTLASLCAADLHGDTRAVPAHFVHLEDAQGLFQCAWTLLSPISHGSSLSLVPLLG